MRFLKVSEDQCNEQGSTIGNRGPRVEFHINSDLVGGIWNKNEVLLKGGNILHLGDKYFINIKLADNIKAADY